jgi:hypothetical protein
MKRLFLFALLVSLSALMTEAQQAADTAYRPEIPDPAYSQGKGPVVFIDEGHFNFHTKNERYLPFAILLERDGYRTEGYSGPFETEKLRKGRILVISNALNEANVQNWFKPVYPAFTDEETEIVRRWVEEGGSLFLIADHMPMGGAAANMAAAFGFGFSDGFAADTARGGATLFCRADNTLADNIITDGCKAAEKVDSIWSFTGQAFTLPPDASPVLTFNDRYLLLLSDTAWVFNKRTVYKPVTGCAQLAFKEYGKGRVVMAGEAAMFTAQLAGEQQIRVGMNSPYAGRNYQLLLNIIHWLDR